MKVELYSFVDIYSRGLDTLAHILTKGREHIAATGTSETEMLDWRLVEDMYPLRRQAEIVCDFAQQWLARAAGSPVPETIESDLSLSDLQMRIEEAKNYLGDLEPAQFEGRDEIPLTYNIGMMEPTFPIAQWMRVFATSNFYFHLSMAYAILRSKGVPLSKPDIFAGRL